MLSEKLIETIHISTMINLQQQYNHEPNEDNHFKTYCEMWDNVIKRSEYF